MKPVLEFSETVKAGVYQHYKGGLYFVEGVAVHTETGEQLVVYRDGHINYFVRPKSLFFEKVEKDGKLVPRFILLREIRTGRMKPSELLESS